MNQIDQKDIERLVLENLVEDGTLLDLENKKIGLEEVQLLCELDEIPTLEKLYLSDNGLGDAELEALAELKLSRKITHLYLNHNYIGDCGCSGLKKLLNAEWVSNLNLYPFLICF